MKTAKKAKVPQQRTELDRLATRLRTALRRETENIIEIGNLLIEIRNHVPHGGWQKWLEENFDLTYRTALNYCHAAEYVERKSKSGETVSHFANLSASVLYRLADELYSEQEEAAILAATRDRRVDQPEAAALCAMVALPDDDEADDDDADEGGDQEDGGEDGGDDGGEDGAKEDANKILDGDPPAVPPPAPNPPPTDFDLRDFDKAISTLNRLKTKSSAQFVKTSHSAEDLLSIEAFIHAVTKARSEGAQ
jgi:hypothetical protein